MAQSSSWTQQQQRHPMYTILTHHRAPPPQLDLNLRSNRAVISCLRVHRWRLRQKKEERTIVDAWGWDFRSLVAFPFAWPILHSTQALASTIFGSLCPPSTHHSSPCSQSGIRNFGSPPLFKFKSSLVPTNEVGESFRDRYNTKTPSLVDRRKRWSLSTIGR